VQIGHRGVQKDAEEHRRRAQGIQGVDSSVGRAPCLGIGHCYSTWPGLLTGCLLRTANGSHLSFFSQIVLLSVVLLRLRRPIREKPNI
jgi:hypothetical protein